MILDKDYKFILWDWKDQPSAPELTSAASEGMTCFNYVETQDDQICLVASRPVLTEEEAQELYDEDQFDRSAPDV